MAGFAAKQTATTLGRRPHGLSGMPCMATHRAVPLDATAAGTKVGDNSQPFASGWIVWQRWWPAGSSRRSTTRTVITTPTVEWDILCHRRYDDRHSAHRARSARRGADMTIGMRWPCTGRNGEATTKFAATAPFPPNRNAKKERDNK
jgi:hypothetical protein